ncbi:MAG TPA: MoaD/ThiS family protein [Candidatus Wallbacteria bacterium]|nr:MoaD/ThiS family protein [Candidatus Wallbacteria bacterium]
MKIRLSLFIDGLDFVLQNPCVNHFGGNEYEVCCDPSLLKLAGDEFPSTEGLLKFLKISENHGVIFVILNSKVVFSNAAINDGDHIELLSAIDGG